MGPSDDTKTTVDARPNEEERNPKSRKARGNRLQLAMNEKTSSGEQLHRGLNAEGRGRQGRICRGNADSWKSERKRMKKDERREKRIREKREEEGKRKKVRRRKEGRKTRGWRR